MDDSGTSRVADPGIADVPEGKSGFIEWNEIK